MLRFEIVLPVLIVAQAVQYVFARKATDRTRPADAPICRHAVDATYMAQTFTAFFSSLLLFAALPQPCNQVFLCELAVILVFCQHCQRLRFPLILLFSRACGGAPVALPVTHTRVAMFPPEVHRLVVLGPVPVGIFAAYSRETFIRRNYRDIRVLRGQKTAFARLAEQALGLAPGARFGFSAGGFADWDDRCSFAGAGSSNAARP